MPENIITIYNAATGEISERAMTSIEIAERLASDEAHKELVAEREAIKASARAKLAALGLTEEEIAAL
jgi:hypothetical protein